MKPYYLSKSFPQKYTHSTRNYLVNVIIYAVMFSLFRLGNKKINVVTSLNFVKSMYCFVVVI